MTTTTPPPLKTWKKKRRSPLWKKWNRKARKDECMGCGAQINVTQRKHWVWKGCACSESSKTIVRCHVHCLKRRWKHTCPHCKQPSECMLASKASPDIIRTCKPCTKQRLPSLDVVLSRRTMDISNLIN